MPRLEDTPATLAPGAPTVSIVVAALNEADTIEPALRSLLALDYPELEVIVVDDRSTDATPAILDRIARGNEHLRVLHLDTLPAGWLGKNHALDCGARIGRGDYLIFTDADIVFDPGTVRRAVAYCERHRLDHLTVLGRVIAHPLLLQMLVLNFSVGLLAYFKPWKVRTSPKHFLGVGGFNMVHASAYRDAGGHAAIPMDVLDDMMLGKLMKSQGYRQQAMLGTRLLSVEWYRSAGEMIRGLQKNMFSVFDYRIGKLLAATLALLVLRVWPWIGLLLGDAPGRVLCALTIGAGLALYADLARGLGMNWRCLVFAPLAGFIELGIWWRAAWLTLRHGGISWRGTHYALAELKREQYGRSRLSGALKPPRQ